MIEPANEVFQATCLLNTKETTMSRKYVTLLLTSAALLLVGGLLWNSETAQAKPPATDSAAVKRTRKTVRMLDDLYKTAVVLITSKYVKTEDDFPAGSAAIALFGAMKKKGWHEVRLLDATGKPINDNNSPRDSFEKHAVKTIKAGKSYYEQIIVKKGKPYLRAATPVPVVLKRCIMCHAHYADAKKGEAIGVLSYTIPIE